MSLICRGCGHEFARRSRSSRDSNLYCGRPCYFRHYPRRGSFPRRRVFACVVVCKCCGHGFESSRHRSLCRRCCPSPAERARVWNVLRWPLIDRVCAGCGQSFTPEYGSKRRVYCSPKCTKRHGKGRSGLNSILSTKALLSGIVDPEQARQLAAAWAGLRRARQATNKAFQGGQT